VNPPETLEPARREPVGAALAEAVALWADATTSPATPRRADLLRDKGRAVEAFFRETGKSPAEVSPLDVKRWQAAMETRGLKPATVYARVSRLSSFYTWAMRHSALGEVLDVNPVRLARPKAPKAYQTESTRALDDGQVRRLVGHLRARAASEGAVAAKRDYALFLFYLLTGMRRAEVIGLRGKDVEIQDDRLVIRSVAKGGDYVAREIRDPLLRSALLDYLAASGRTKTLRTDGPLWTRHDPGAWAGGALTSHAFVANLKRYAAEAEVGHVHLHQLRHTFARLVA